MLCLFSTITSPTAMVDAASGSHARASAFVISPIDAGGVNASSSSCISAETELLGAEPEIL